MTLLTAFSRVSKARRCPVCDHADWCLIERQDQPAKVICTRVESPTRWGEAGWLHRLRDDDDRRTVRRVRTVHSAPVLVGSEFGRMAEDFAAAVNPEALSELAAGLGLTAPNLTRLGVGWNGWAWSFPMKDPSGGMVGIRLRRPDGSKLAVRGGREGLFIPTGLDEVGQLLIAEGPTDTAALLDLGFTAIGRPSCNGGARHLVGVVRSLRPSRVVIVADADAPGVAGAANLACVLCVYCRDVRIVRPPPPHKDARAWVTGGARRGDVESLIAQSSAHRLSVQIWRVGS